MNEWVCQPCQKKDIEEFLERDRQQKIQRRKEYGGYLESDHWKAIRKAALQQSNYQCSKCGSKSDLNVHHKTYARKGHERLDDLEVLCYQCHMETHAYLERMKNFDDYGDY